MKRVVTAQQMRQYEQMVMRRGLPGRVLMELAAHAVTQKVLSLHKSGGEVLVCCGAGNNGGDGLACARQLAMHGVSVRALLLAPPDKLRGDALENYRAAVQLGVPVAIADMESPLPRCDVIVDALFGTGLSRDIEGAAARLIEKINQSACDVVAVDIPSGVDADTGAVRGVAVRAAYTVTFQYAKLGHLLFPGRQYCGELCIAPLSPEVFDEAAPDGAIANDVATDAKGDAAQQAVHLSAEDIAKLLPKRAPDSHKGSHGRALLIAGSTDMAGAACMAARAALRSGCGLLTVALPQSARLALQCHCPEAMALTLEEESGARVQQLDAALEGKTCVAIGPGLGRGEAAKRTVMHILKKTTIPIVADADALFAIAEDIPALKRVGAPLILTPHVGEMARLCGCSAGDIAASPIAHARAFAKAHNAVVHLKGATSITASPTGEVTLTTAGNAGLAKGGSGDVLTGVITALLAQGLGGYDAARLGALLLGLASDAAKAQTGERGMLASDVIEALCVP